MTKPMGTHISKQDVKMAALCDPGPDSSSTSEI